MSVARTFRYQRVCVEGIGYALPGERVTSDEIERRLAPLYERLRLPAGRLELMTGIRERRFWPRDALPGEVSATTARRALDAARLAPRDVGALLHGSVCRDRLEPATACGVHHRLGLPGDCVVYDVSNACLGILNGIVQVANMIELGQIRAGLVVGTENGRALVENTIAALNRDEALTRNAIKSAVASLTIGSASAAVALAHCDASRTQCRLLGGAALAATAHHELCQSGRDEAADAGMSPLMQTDSERLMREGVAAAQRCFVAFCDAFDWRGRVQKSVGHQVGLAHRKLLLDTLELDAANDFTTIERLGNTGSAALPVTLALGAEQGHFSDGDRTALLGIGSGVNVVMLAVDWRTTPVLGDEDDNIADPTAVARQDPSEQPLGRAHGARIARATKSRSK